MHHLHTYTRNVPSQYYDSVRIRSIRVVRIFFNVRKYARLFLITKTQALEIGIDYSLCYVDMIL